MRQFDIPLIYRSPLISHIKKQRKQADKLKKDFSPLEIQFGQVSFVLARHFGFCYGVENAIEIAYRTIEENQGKNIYLLSEMIHNPQVNEDLLARGLKFLQDTQGKQIIPFESLTADDIVIIPAFGTTLAIEEKLQKLGIQTEKYNTTCPFVEKVWNRSENIAKSGYTIIIHGKPSHEETRATFSHASAFAPSVVVKDLNEAKKLANYLKNPDFGDFFEDFKGQYSPGFDPKKDLQKIGVVNQTTMLAEETQEIAQYLRAEILENKEFVQEKEYVADMRDTLCYATNDNQTAVKALLQTKADLCLVIGGPKSSNTTHLVELAEPILPTYFITTAQKLVNREEILSFNIHTHKEELLNNWLPTGKAKILITSGASCPDALVEEVMAKLYKLVNENENWKLLVDRYIIENA
jgi:4-hydroxy-3-methylbut-2-en-1-yl diphosphate reductase